MSRVILAAASVVLAGAVVLGTSRAHAADAPTNVTPITPTHVASTSTTTPPHDSSPREVRFSATPLKDVINFLSDASGANFSVDWKALEAVKVTKDTPITLRVSASVKLRKILTMVLQQTDGTGKLTFYVDDGVIQITSQDQEDKEMVTRIYPIQDLLFQAPDYNDAPSLNLQPQQQTGGGGTSGSTGNSTSGNNGIFNSTSTAQTSKPAKSRNERANEIIKLITDTVRPEIWQVNGGAATINYFRGNLIVHAPRSVQAQLSSH